MNRRLLFILVLPLALAACSTVSPKDTTTIATLRDQTVQIREERIEGGLDKAMLSYQRFLEDTPDSELKPEALRRLADLKLEKEYGTLTGGAEPAARASALPAPGRIELPQAAAIGKKTSDEPMAARSVHGESEAEFEKRSTLSSLPDSTARAASDLERAETRDAVALYEKLLSDYPHYERNDQVLYQMSRAYEELGEIEKAMAVMDRMVREYPGSRNMDEVQFRRAESFFAYKRYLDAEDAYQSIVDTGEGSSFYELALYKLGWTFYKQELYEDALNRFIALMDHKVSKGYDFENTGDEQERKRTDDTFRVISLSFSNLGGADSAVQYFSNHGKRSYEDKIYSNLGEFYLDKRRYADAAASYNAFVDRNPQHKMAPNFQMRVIEIQAAGGFPSLVLDSKKKFARSYGLNAGYWNYFKPGDRPDVLGLLKTNLTDLGNHYHACYQDPNQAEDKPANFEEALLWYQEFLASFPADLESPVISFQMADLLLENRSLAAAAVQFEKTAYEYPTHGKSSQAGYAAVAVYRELLGAAAPADEDETRREVVRSSLKFADTFPDHEKAAIVLGAAADDLYDMKEYKQALAAARRLIEMFPDTDVEVVREAWLVAAHSSYELSLYSEAESSYLNVLALLPGEDETRRTLTNNLAASIYKQGEQADAAQDYRAAADHFLRVGRAAPGSTIRPTAEYDAAAALIQLQDWEAAVTVLEKFRGDFPDSTLQSEVTKKLAYVYEKNNQLSFAANEYERVERESEDDEIRREALLVAARLHEEDGSTTRALEVYRRYVEYFPQPVEVNLETRNKIAGILGAQGEREAYLTELEMIVAIDAAAGSAQTPRTRYIAAQAALVLAINVFDKFTAVKLVEPLEDNLRLKRELMKTATEDLGRLVDYGIGEVTAAATFYLAEIYSHFSRALMTSERPEGLSPLEMEQYDLALEEEAYPFEEKAIDVHESNLKLIPLGVYNEWIEKGLQRLAETVPARYDKPEEASGIMSSLRTYIFAINRPALIDSQISTTEEPRPAVPGQAEEPGSVTEVETVKPAQSGESDPDTEDETVQTAQDEEPGPDVNAQPGESAPGEDPDPVVEPETDEPGQSEPESSLAGTDQAARSQ
ncbi:MAG: tetratricopeptide repeat protein [bacterium]|nr:tetratricopeptide repeat protein [bacterium]MDT8395254.1 tetratricopeptide repeat protein [bacterium]